MSNAKKMKMMMVAKVERQTLEACMKCPLCYNIFKEATTISLCLHTFCRKCIYEKLSDEEMDCCPVCNIDLGCMAVEKLRPDHNLQDMRAKLFPFKRKKIRAQEVVPSVSPPAKRKERSLSSLVVSAPKVLTNTGFTGKRTKTSTRKASALRGCNFNLEESIKTEEKHGEHNLVPSTAEPSKKHRPNEDTKNSMDLTEEKVDLWTPLHCLLEVANRTKFSKPNSQGTPHAKLEGNLATPQGGQKKSETTTKSETLASVQSAKTKDNGHKAKVGDDKDGKTLPSGPRKRRRVRPDGQKREAASKIMLDATENRCYRENSPIWFSLVASEDQRGDFPLPQISACYLRIKDGNVPVSFIHKYLAKKLNLASEAEVEITCRGQSLLPSLKLHNIVDLWMCTTPTSKKIRASVGSSAKEFVMVLSYSRKPLPPL